MKFHCTRVSNSSEKPCEEASQEKHVGIDHRSSKSFDEFKAATGEDFLARGINHRIEDGHIVRDLDIRPIWVVELPSMKALMAFIDKYGQVILGRCERYHKTDGSLVIYDDYVE